MASNDENVQRRLWCEMEARLMQPAMKEQLPGLQETEEMNKDDEPQRTISGYIDGQFSSIFRSFFFDIWAKH